MEQRFNEARRLIIIALVGQDGNHFRNTTRSKALVSLCISPNFHSANEIILWIFFWGVGWGGVEFDGYTARGIW